MLHIAIKKNKKHEKGKQKALLSTSLLLGSFLAPRARKEDHTDVWRSLRRSGVPGLLPGPPIDGLPL
jgi:hypothetical protein